MEIVRNNLKQLDQIGLRLEKLKVLPFDDMQDKLIDQKIYDKVNIFINSLEGCKLEGKNFLTALVMNFHMSNMVDNVETKENNEIYLLIKETLQEYEILFTIDLSNDIIKKFIERLNIFNDLFVKWKDNDLLKVIEEYAKLYFSLELYKTNNKITDIQRMNIDREQNKVKELVNKIGGMEQFKKYSSLTFDKSAIKSMEDQIKIKYKEAYWDKLKEDLDNKNYDSILLNLEEIRARIALMTPKRIDIHQKLAEYIDIDFIKQMLENEAIDNKYIYNLVNYIIDKLKEMEAPVDNVNTENWRKETIKLFNSDINKSEFFAVFFQKTFDKIEKIEQDIEKFKNSLNK